MSNKVPATLLVGLSSFSGFMASAMLGNEITKSPIKVTASGIFWILYVMVAAVCLMLSIRMLIEAYLKENNK